MIDQTQPSLEANDGTRHDAERGAFIVLEGIEGVGKTTQMAVAQRALEQAGKALVCTREPGGTAAGEALRSVLLDKDGAPLSLEAETLLMFAARANHLHEKIRPALNRGDWVLCDRFTDASYAYQGAGRQLGVARIAVLEKWVQAELRPDLVIVLDADPELALTRAKNRGPVDRFEQESLDFFHRARQVYLDRAKDHPERYAVIDASMSLEDVTAAVEATVSGFARQWGVS
ncbi:MAG: dTMP kinase [Gammaproteobacteria bacterium]|nr:dTMP kinase [Gammaproteobacteria bacterium]